MTKRMQPDEKSLAIEAEAVVSRRVTIRRPSSSPARSLFTIASRRPSTAKRPEPADCRSSGALVAVAKADVVVTVFCTQRMVKEFVFKAIVPAKRGR